MIDALLSPVPAAFTFVAALGPPLSAPPDRRGQFCAKQLV
jgi:hypothetical protein